MTVVRVPKKIDVAVAGPAPRGKEDSANELAKAPEGHAAAMAAAFGPDAKCPFAGMFRNEDEED